MDKFKHSHSLGQNFLTDTNLLAAIVQDAGVLSTDTVIEVGAGQGALTRPLAKTNAEVFSFEIDNRLTQYLSPIEAQYPNLHIIYGDFMKHDISLITKNRYKAVANLPYYITTPVLFKFLDDPNCISVTVMVQKEVAERIAAKPGGKDYGVLSVSAQLAGNPKITRIVGRQMFTPPPNVDSAVVKIEIINTNVPSKVKNVAKAAFAMRRKTLINCLASAGYDKETVLKSIAELGYPPDVRGERLSPQDFIKLSQSI